MNSIAAPIFGLRQFPWLRKHGFAVRLGVCFLSIASITVAVIPGKVSPSIRV